MLFEPVESKWHVTRSLQHHWPRTDFLDQLRQEAIGHSPIGAAGDFQLGEHSSKIASSNGQLQRVIRQLATGGTNRIQGIKVANTPPMDGQALVFDAATGYYTPETIVTSPSKSIMGGSQAGVSFNIDSGNPLLICPIGGNSISATVVLTQESIIAPYSGTIRNLYFIALFSSAANAATYTITVLRNQVATAVTASGTISGSLLTLQDLTHSAAITAGDEVQIILTSTGVVANTISELSFGLEYDNP